MSGAISVIMPAYNAAATIRDSLESALRQTRAAQEIVVVDDGSQDATAAIVADIAREHPAVVLLRQANAGPMVARNAAIAHSRGVLIAPLDADDLWHDDYLADVAGAVEADGASGFAYALHRVIDADGRVVLDGGNWRVAGHCLYRLAFMNVVGNGSAAVFRRQALLAVGGYDEATQGWGGAEDYLLQLRIAAVAPVVQVPRFLVGYRRLPDSYSSAPEIARRARLLAVEEIRTVRPDVPAQAGQWAASDASRVLAVQQIRRRRFVSALCWGLRGVSEDPRGSVSDFCRRILNMAKRKGMRRDNAISPDFLSLDPDTTLGGGPDAQTIERLAWLESCEVGRQAAWSPS